MYGPKLKREHTPGVGDTYYVLIGAGNALSKWTITDLTKKTVELEQTDDLATPKRRLRYRREDVDLVEKVGV